jgi:hypothetical protein
MKKSTVVYFILGLFLVVCFYVTKYQSVKNDSEERVLTYDASLSAINNDDNKCLFLNKLLESRKVDNKLDQYSKDLILMSELYPGTNWIDCYKGTLKKDDSLWESLKKNGYEF